MTPTLSSETVTNQVRQKKKKLGRALPLAFLDAKRDFQTYMFIIEINSDSRMLKMKKVEIEDNVGLHGPLLLVHECCRTQNTIEVRQTYFRLFYNFFGQVLLCYNVDKGKSQSGEKTTSES